MYWQEGCSLEVPATSFISAVIGNREVGADVMFASHLKKFCHVSV